MQNLKQALFVFFSFLFSVPCAVYAQTATAAVVSTAVADGSFETPNISTGTYQYTPPGAGWNFYFNSGITDNNSIFTVSNPTPPDGSQVLFLQQNASVSKTITLPASGPYRFSIKAAQRGTVNTTGQIVRVLIDGVVLAQITPSSTSYALYRTPIYWFTNGNHVIKLEGIVTTGNNTALVDDVRFESIPCWSQASTWQNNVLPSSTSTALIPAGFTVALDATNCVTKKVNIDGVLTAPLNTNFNLAAECVHVRSGGLLEIGHETNPYTAEGKITLVGSDVNSVQCGEMGTKFIGGMPGSRIELHGKPQKSWSQLNATAINGNSTITLKEAVDWQVGDRIVIASTEFDMNKVDECTITAVSGDQKTLTLNATLNHKHFGQLQAYSSTNGQSWTVDERAEVGLLSRNLVVEGDAASGPLAFGGHIMIMMGSVAHIDNVELNRMGQRHKKGRYPFHWHIVGNASGQYFNNNSVHNTYNRAITVHSTSNATVRDNVCYDNLGHAIFLEDGNETGNVITGNLGLVTRRPCADYEFLPSDRSEHRNASGPATFWITHPNNIVQNNRAAGSDGSGFWFAFYQDPNSESYVSGLNPNVLNIPAGNVDNNTAHSGYHGWLVGMAPPGNDILERPDFSNDYQPTISPTFTGITVYKNRLGLYSRIGANNNLLSTYVNLIVADNWEGEANTWLTDIRQSLWVGASQNYGPIPVAPQSPSAGTENLIIGHVLYDGPTRIYNSHFAGFNDVNFSLFDQWNANFRYHGHSLHNTTHAADSYRIKFRDRYTEPLWFSGSITDVDGRFTGTAMKAIVQNHPMMIDNANTTAIPNGNARTSNHRYGFVELRTSDEVEFPAVGDEQNRRQTSQLARSDGPSWIERRKDLHGVGLTMMLNGTYQYKYLFHKNIPSVSRLDYYSMNSGEWVILEILNVPSTANIYSGTANGFYAGTNLVALPRVSTVAQLQVATQTTAAYVGGSMFIRFQAPSGKDFRSNAIVGSVFLCLSGNCVNGTNFSFPDADGDGKSNISELLTSPFFVRSDNEVNDLSFDFTDGDSEEWFKDGTVADNGFENNQWLLRASGNNPQIIRSGLNIDGNKVKYIDIRTLSQASGNYTFYWQTTSDNTFDVSRSVTVNYTTDWELLRFKVGDHPLWKGKQIKAIRIDPAAVNNVNILVDWVKAKNTWIFDINKMGTATNTTFKLIDGGGNDCNAIIPAAVVTALGQADNTCSFDLTDWNMDGYTDIAVFKKQATSTGFTEIYVLDGKTNYQTFLFQSATAFTYMNLNDHIFLADYNGDKKPDIWYIGHNTTSSNMTEVHVVDGNNPQLFLLQDITALPLAPNTINDYCLYDYDGDKKVDLWYIQKQGASNKTEIRILKNTGGAGTFDTFFSAPIISVLPNTNANWTFEVTDYNRDGVADVVGIDRVGTSNKVDVQILNGVGNFQNFLLLMNTPMPSGNSNHAYLVDNGTGSVGTGYNGRPPVISGMTTKTEELDEVLVYPNPANDEVLIHLGDDAGKTLELTITPLNGGTVSLSKFYKASDIVLRVALDDLASGVYVLQLNFAEGKRIQKKLVITK